MNSAYVMGARLTDSFAKTGFCTAIRSLEGGGNVEGLPAHAFTTDEGDLDLKCPTEIGIADRREAELSKLGFLPLCHYKNTDSAVFLSADDAKSKEVRAEGRDRECGYLGATAPTHGCVAIHALPAHNLERHHRDNRECF